MTGTLNSGLQLHIRVCVLAVRLCAFSVLYGKPGAAMQAAQAHRALLPNPHGPSVLHGDRLYRALFCAQAAAGAAILLNMEMSGFSGADVIYRLRGQFREGRRQTREHSCVCAALVNTANYAVDLHFRRSGKRRNFFPAWKDRRSASTYPPSGRNKRRRFFGRERPFALWHRRLRGWFRR